MALLAGEELICMDLAEDHQMRVGASAWFRLTRIKPKQNAEQYGTYREDVNENVEL